MEIKRRSPRHPRRGPSCLGILFLGALIFAAGFAFAQRNEIAEAVLPDPTAEPTQSAPDLAVRALIYERDGLETQAVTALESALELDPDNSIYAVDLVDLLVRTDQHDEALEVVDQAIERDENNDQLWVVKAQAHLAKGYRLETMGESEGDHFLQAIEAGRRAYTINPENSSAYAYTAAGLNTEGSQSWAEAQEMADNALFFAPISPQNPNETDELVTALFYSAETFTNQGWYESARDNLEQANQLDPSHVETALVLSSIYYFYDQNRAGAIDLLRLATEYEPTNADIYDLLSFYYLNGGAFPQAEENAAKAVQFDPEMVRARAHLGHAYFKNNNNYPKAIEELEIAVDLYGSQNSENALYFTLLGLAYYFEDEQNCDKAIPLFEETLTVAADFSPAKINAEDGLEFCRQARLNG